MNKKTLLSSLIVLGSILSSNMVHANGWTAGVRPEYSSQTSKWVSASDISGTSIMSKIRGSYTYKNRLPNLTGLTYRQEKMIADGKHYVNITTTTTPYGPKGFTRWYDSPFGVVLDYLTPYSPGNTFTSIPPDASSVSDVPAALQEFNRVQFPNGSKTVYVAGNLNDLADAKSASAAMAKNNEPAPLILANINNMKYDNSAFTRADQMKAKNIIMLGGTNLVEATSGLDSGYNIIRVGGHDRQETADYLNNLPTKMQTLQSYKGDGSGVVMVGLNDTSVYNDLVKLSQTQNITYLKSAVNKVLTNNAYLGSTPSRGQSPSIVLGVNNGDFETYWVCYFYQKAEGRATYQYVLPNFFPKISFSKNPSGWTNGNVEVTASFTIDNKVSISSKKWASGNKDVSYFKNSGNTLASNNKFTVSENGVYTVYVKDSYGNETVNTINITNIDKTAPSGNAWIENVSQSGFDVVVNNLSDSQSGVNRVEICAWHDGWNVDGKWQTDYRSSGTARFRVNTSDYSGKAGNYYIDVRVFDNAGNGGTPIAHLTPTVPYPNVYSSPIAISNHEYQSGNVYWVQSGNSFTVKSFGYTNPNSSRYKINKEYVMARSESASNFNNYKAFGANIPTNLTYGTKHYDTWISTNTFNTSLRLGTGSYSVRTEGSWVDTFFNLILDGDESVKLSPVVRMEADGKTFDSDWYGSSIIVKSDSQAPSISLNANPNKTWSNLNVTVSIGVTDERSGVKNWTVRRKLNNGSWINLTDKTTSVVLSEDGTHVIEVTATDNVNNSRTSSITVKVDKTAPTIALTPSTTNWTNGNITVTANITDGTSGVSVKKWAAGNRDKSYFANAGEALGSSFVAISNGVYTVYAKDVAGNESVKTITINKIDKNPPTITGDLDNSWVKGNKVISFTATDDLSGVSSIKLWNEAKTSVLKTGTVNNNVGTLSHTITTEGITKYKIEAIDNANNTTTSNVTVRIDNTPPTTSIAMPTITDNKIIEISLTNIADTLSGIKEVWVSEKSDFSTGVTKVGLSGLTSKKFNFTLSAKKEMGLHFSNRTVYIRLYDNVGNYTNYTRNVRLIPAKPSTPIINTPTEDSLYTKGESVLLSWTYESEDIDLGKLPQLKAEIELTLKGGASDGSDKIYIYEVEGEIFKMSLKDLEFGDYEVKVRVYNYLNPSVFSESEVVRFRFNSFKGDGNVITKDIITTSPIKYLLVLTKYEIPKDSKIEGYIYYETDSNGNFNKNKYKTFELTDDFNTRNIIELPVKVTKIRVEYKLKRSPSDKLISPILDDVIVLAK